MKKIMGKGTEKELLYFLFITNSNIFAQTVHPQVKKKIYPNLVDSGQSNNIFVETCNFIKKETLAHVFSCEFCEISKKAFFTELLWATASKIWTPREPEE